MTISFRNNKKHTLKYCFMSLYFYHVTLSLYSLTFLLQIISTSFNICGSQYSYLNIIYNIHLFYLCLSDNWLVIENLANINLLSTYSLSIISNIISIYSFNTRKNINYILIKTRHELERSFTYDFDITGDIFARFYTKE